MVQTITPSETQTESRLFSARSARLLVEDTLAASTTSWPDLVLSRRVSRLLQRLDEKSHVAYRTNGDQSLPQEQMGEPFVVRRALAFAMVLREMPVYIQPDEMLVGGRSMYGSPEDRKMDVFPELTGIASVLYFPTYTTPVEDAAAGMPGGAASNHNALGFGRLLEMGLARLRAYAMVCRDKIAVDTSGLTKEEKERRMAFYRAVDICLEAVSGLAMRYVALASDMAGRASGAERSRLSEIADICRRVSQEPPETFRQALQLFLFARVASMVESYSCMPLGRFDQYLWPILRRDLIAGRTTRDEARELLECLFIKLNEEIDLSSTDDCQRIMLSGQTSDGDDATNELSYLCLEASIRLRLPSPKVGVRLHRNTPPAFFQTIVDTIKLGIAGLPELYNDEGIIPGLLQYGIPLFDALDYCHDGCSEITLPGKSDFYPTWTGVRHLRIFREALYDISEDATWPELLGFYKERLREAIRMAVRNGNARDAGMAIVSPAPFLSSTLEGCLEQGLDKTWGGTIYNMTGLLGAELVNAANALAAVRRIVYEEKAITLGNLKVALDSDFAGMDGERLRLRLRNRAPKFGNDDPAVDDLAAEVAEVFINEGQSHTNPRGGRFCPGFFDFAGYVSKVKDLGATPDGRHAGESVSGHLAPVGGTDRNGVTANLKSMSRVTSLHPPMGTMFDIKLHPSAVRGQAASEKLGALIRAFMALDGKALQFNIVDAATLRAAQANPEKYRDLLVRVWGFSAYFVELSSDFQEHIINRTEHAL